jgi:hypothetical protein
VRIFVAPSIEEIKKSEVRYIGVINLLLSDYFLVRYSLHLRPTLDRHSRIRISVPHPMSIVFF